MTAPLNPCPAGCHTDFITMQQVGVRHMMKCDCGWTAPIRANKECAIAAWNTRSDAPELVGLVEALREISTAPPHNTDGIIARAAIRTYEAMK